MKTSELFEAKSKDSGSDTIIGSLLLKLHREKVPMKVLITGLTKRVRGAPGDGIGKSVAIPDQEWDITSVRLMKTPNGNFVRVSNKSPEQWFELNPDDDNILTIKTNKEGGYKLLTSRDGKGVKH